jgi:hypothetical protein
LNYRVGIDFDNTIVCYYDLLISIVTELNWLKPPVPNSKKELRDRLRLIEGGDRKWQQLQALIYGPRIKEARIFDGFREFLSHGYNKGLKCFIVSHKTQYAFRDDTGIDLQHAALELMKNNNLLGVGNSLFKRSDIFFESTREEKIRRVIELGCTHFIDDLHEIFEHKEFPPDVKKILFNPVKSSEKTQGLITLSSWNDISQYVLGENIA